MSDLSVKCLIFNLTLLADFCSNSIRFSEVGISHQINCQDFYKKSDMFCDMSAKKIILSPKSFVIYLPPPSPQIICWIFFQQVKIESFDMSFKIWTFLWHIKETSKRIIFDCRTRTFRPSSIFKKKKNLLSHFQQIKYQTSKMSWRNLFFSFPKQSILLSLRHLWILLRIFDMSA